MCHLALHWLHTFFTDRCTKPGNAWILLLFGIWIHPDRSYSWTISDWLDCFVLRRSILLCKLQVHSGSLFGQNNVLAFWWKIICAGYRWKNPPIGKSQVWKWWDEISERREPPTSSSLPSWESSLLAEHRLQYQITSAHQLTKQDSKLMIYYDCNCFHSRMHIL